MPSDRQLNSPRLWRALCAAMIFGAITIGAILLRRVVDPGPQTAVEGTPQPASPDAPAGSPPLVVPNPEPAAAPDEFRRIESQCIEVAKTVRPAVVGVMSPSKAALPRPGKHAGGGSGVIISADGLVLSQMHVSHMRANTRDFTKPHHAPGEEATVFLADGRECKAKLLGASLEYDLSLLQLPGPGPYPFVPLSADVAVHKGDWAVKLGHPLGFRKDRPAPVRLGRVLLATPDAFATDCPIMAGDSGGPFFDLDGRLTGVLYSNDAGVFTHLHGLRVGDWIDPELENTWMAVATPRIAALVESMKKGEVHPLGSVAHVRTLAAADRLAGEEWTRGKQSKAVFEPSTRAIKAGVVTVLNEGVPVAFGTVVEKELAVVMASTLPPRPQCRLPDGSVTAVTVVGVDKAYDLAVIRISTTAIRPVPWAERDSLPAASAVAAVGPEGTLLTIGVVSVASRQLADARTPTHELPLRVKADRPGVYGEQAKDGGGYVVRMVERLEKVAGIKVGDRLLSIAGHRIAGEDDLTNAVRDKLSGDAVSVSLVRDGKDVTVQLPLLPHVAGTATNATWRCDDYPAALEYSPPVRTVECGGPLVDLSGRVVAVTVGRAAGHAGWAIPEATVRKIVDDARCGRLNPWPSK